MEQVSGALAVRRAEARRYDILAWKPLGFPAELTLRESASAVSFRFDYVTVSEKVVDVPAQPLLLPQVPRYPGFEATPGAPRVDVVPCREGEAAQLPDSHHAFLTYSNHELIETGVGAFQ